MLFERGKKSRLFASLTHYAGTSISAEAPGVCDIDIDSLAARMAEYICKHNGGLKIALVFDGLNMNASETIWEDLTLWSREYKPRKKEELLIRTARGAVNRYEGIVEAKDLLHALSWARAMGKKTHTFNLIFQINPENVTELIKRTATQLTA